MSQEEVSEELRRCPECRRSILRTQEGDLAMHSSLYHWGTWCDGGELRALGRSMGIDRLAEHEGRGDFELRTEPPRQCPACNNDSRHGGWFKGYSVGVCYKCGG